MIEAPLVQRASDPTVALPSTWCVIECSQGCRESWSVDVADFDPRLTAGDVERLLTPVLLEHEQDHQDVWRGGTRNVDERKGDSMATDDLASVARPVVTDTNGRRP